MSGVVSLVEDALIYKYYQWWQQSGGSIKLLKKQSEQGALRPIGLIPRNFYTEYKTIISAELDQRVIRPIEFIPSSFLSGCKSIISIG